MDIERIHLDKIVNYLKDKRKLDFGGYYSSMILRRIEKRMYNTKSPSLEKYYHFLINTDTEIDHLIDVLTINVSRFYRDSYVFEFVKRFVIPDLILSKIQKGDKTLRVWSTACSTGEEAYTMAMIIDEFLSTEDFDIDVKIFATDIDKKALKKAQKAVYDFESVQDVKFETLNRYFKQDDDSFVLDKKIRKMVSFSYFDLLNEDSLVPPESIFGDFDIVLCRNVLIYFKPKYQLLLFEKMAKSLKNNSWLILGEAELPIKEFKHLFVRETPYCKVYRKDDYVK